MRIGIDIGGTNIKAGLVDAKGKVVERTKVNTPANEEPERTIDVIESIVKKFGKAEAIGIGVPGIIDHQRGIVRISPNLPRWINFPFLLKLDERIKIPAKILNDVNAIAWGEFIFGAGMGFRNIFTATLGTGLGGAVILDGKLHLGSIDAAGEIGHITLVRNGIECLCGKRGCVERYVGRDAITRRAKEKRPDLTDIDPELISKAGHNGEEWAVEVYREVAEDLAQVLSNVIQLLNVERIIIGGQIAGAGNLLFTPLKKAVVSYVQPVISESFQIVKSELGNDAGIIGAAFY